MCPAKREAREACMRVKNGSETSPTNTTMIKRMSPIDQNKNLRRAVHSQLLFIAGNSVCAG